MRVDPYKFKIVTFDPKYISAQVRLGNTVTKDWKYYSQSSEEYIRNLYGKPDFDPNTRFYMVNNSGDELIGFLTTKILDNETAHFAPPIVKNDHYSFKVDLMNHAIQVLRERGIHDILFTSSPIWGNTDALIREFEFKIQSILFQEYTIGMDTFLKIASPPKLSSSPIKIEDYHKKHRPEVIENLSRILEVDYQEMQITLENNLLPNLENEINKVLLDRDNVVGWIRGSIITSIRQKILSITPGYIFDHQFENYRMNLIHSVLVDANNIGVEKLKLIITEKTFSQGSSLPLELLELVTELKKYDLQI